MKYPKLRAAEEVGIMQASLERTETRSHCAARRGDELRGQAEICRQLAASLLMERHKLVWLRLARAHGIQLREQLQPPRR
jgi:hypothetical protein